MSRVQGDIQEVLVSRKDRESVATAQKRPVRFIQATISYLPGFHGMQKVQ